MKSKLICVCLSVVMAFSLSGCKKFRETDMQYTVASLGFDGKGGITVYAEVITVNMQSSDDGSNGQAGNMLLEAKGKNVVSAFKELRRMTSKPLFFSHCGLICLDGSLSEKSIKEILRYCHENDEINHTVYFIKSDITKELLSAKPNSEMSNGYAIMGVIKQSEETNCVCYNNMFYEIEMSRKGAEDFFALPRFYLKDGIPVTDGVAVYSDCKVKAELSDSEVFYYYAIRGLSRKGLLVIGDEKANISFTKTSFKADFNGNLKFKIKLYFEYSGRNFKEQIKENCQRLIYKSVREFKTDIFGFEDNIYKKYGAIWNTVKNDYNERFLNSETEILVDCNEKKHKS